MDVADLESEGDMGWPPETFRIPDELRELIRGGKCFLLLGSGLSSGSYYSWFELANALCADCGSDFRVTRDSTADELLDAAQDAKDCDRASYYAFLGEHFGKPASHASFLYDVLLSLPFECYLTVNFDPLLALKARTARLECLLPPQAYPSLHRRRAAKRTLHYLHGMIGENERPAKGPIVLSRQEFEDAYCANGNLMNFLVPTLTNEHMLFVGCRLKEPVMPKIFNICKQHQLERLQVATERGHCTPPPNRFIMLSKPIVNDKRGRFDRELSEAEMTVEEDYYRGMDIIPVWYPATANDHSALRLALDTIAELPGVIPDHGWQGGNDESW